MNDPNAGRPGYKETKVGWIPEEWDVRRLDTVADRQTGHTPDKDVAEYWSGGRKWVSLSDSDRLDRVWIRDTTKEISDLGLENSSARLLPAGTVVLLRDASVGRVGIIGEEMAVSQHFVAWICNGELHNLFLYYWLLSQRRALERQAVGTTIVTIGMPYFAKLQVPIPPLCEQIAIGRVLHDCDAALERTNELIAAEDIRSRYLRHELLTGHRRLPGHDEPWQSGRMSDSFDRVTRRNDSGCQNLVTISGSRGMVRQEDYFTKRIASDDASDYFLLRRGEFAYNKSKSGGHPLGAIKMLTTYEEGVVSTLNICFRLKDSADNAEFARMYLEGGCLNHELYRIAQEGARHHGLLNVTPSDFFNCEISFPAREEQDAIVAMLSTAETVLSLLREKREALRRQKKALMQKLLTGQVRVKV